MDILRIGVLGTARIAATALLGPAASVPEVTVAAVAARDQFRAEAYAEQHGIPVAYGGYEALLADPDIDAVYNPLPNSLHGPWTLRAIAAGKHVLCEKPFASNAQEAAQVADAASVSGLVVMEAMHYRYHPLIRRLRELVGELGPVRHIQCWTSFVIGDEDDIRYDYDLGGGALMDGGCYALDCLRLLGPGEPEVTAALADPYQRVPGRGPDRAGAAADRTMAARLVFPGDATAWFESAFTLDGEFRAGVGSALMHAVLGAGDALGEPLVALLGDPGYYERFGFRLGSEYQITPPVAGWQPHFQVRLLTAYRPSVRGTFRYAEPFDRV